MIAHLLCHVRKARNPEREVLGVIFAYERKEDQTKIPGECPPRNVLGSSRMAHPDHSSLAICEADILPRGRDGHYFFFRVVKVDNILLCGRDGVAVLSNNSRNIVRNTGCLSRLA